MPWSPANTTTRGRVNGLGGHMPWHAASHTPSSSSRPSEPAGLVSSRCLATACRCACWSGAAIAGNCTTRTVPSPVMAFRWRYEDAAGAAVDGPGIEFDDRDDAEDWLGANWSPLLDAGIEQVTLMDGDSEVF